MTELLAPAGNEQAAVCALTSGADAIYLGVGNFSARSEANFDEDAFRRIIRLAHLLGAKVYVALNTLVKERELDEFFARAKRVWEDGADAILMQDLFLGYELKSRYPQMVLHLSTQAGCCNLYGAQVAKRYGFSRVVLARETPIKDMGAISEVIETEAFVQGALCTAFSGQCYFSSFAGGCSGNRGMCKQPCRKLYSIDRKGFEERAYALSTSDLMVGERIGELLRAGITSLKIEGRLRRPEYVGAAVKYYRALLDGAPSDEARTALKRAYNRGDYTEGLAFGQKAGFLSRDVQGHIGERVGTVSYLRAKPMCRSEYPAQKGDGFKILRAGKEAGGALYAGDAPGGFFLSSSARLQEGDEVRLTTCVSSNEFAVTPQKTRPISIFLRMIAGEVPVATCEGLTVRGDDVLSAAKNAPLSEAELFACFQRTDGLPLAVTVHTDTDGVFLPKSALNAFRRKFYEALSDFYTPPRDLPEHSDSWALSPAEGTLTAQIGGKRADADIFIVKPHDYHALTPDPAAFLYLPPFLTAEDEALLSDVLPQFAGIYCEGYYGIALAEKYHLPLFAGAGWNLTNRYAVREALKAARYVTLSKELSTAEQNALSAPGAFALTAGAIKTMDLIYCPFGRTCKSCDRKEVYCLTDEAGRRFPLSRYRIADMGCRFEVYNCASLRTEGAICNQLYDRSVPLPASETSGHAQRSMR